MQNNDTAKQNGGEVAFYVIHRRFVSILKVFREIHFISILSAEFIIEKIADLKNISSAEVERATAEKCDSVVSLAD